MSLATTVESVSDGVRRVRMSGRLDAVSALEFEPVLQPLAENPLVSRIILDTEGLDYIASAGLRVLLKAIKTMGPRGATLYGLNMGEPILAVLRMTGLLPFVNLRDTFEDCLA